MPGLDTAQLVVYSTLSIPIFYITSRHGLPGLLAWLYLLVFCSLRIVGGALALGGNNSQSAALISNIGISPLLLAISGILHEARKYRKPNRNPKLEWVLVLSYHVLVTTGLALLASGASAFKDGNFDTDNRGSLKAGITVLLLAWLTLALCTLASLMTPQPLTNTQSFVLGSKLLSSVMATIPSAGIRVLYSLLSIFAPSKSLNPVDDAVKLRIGLEFVQEMIVVVVLVVAGLMTRDINNAKNSEEMSPYSRGERRRNRR